MVSDLTSTASQRASSTRRKATSRLGHPKCPSERYDLKTRAVGRDVTTISRNLAGNVEYNDISSRRSGRGMDASPAAPRRDAVSPVLPCTGEARARAVFDTRRSFDEQRVWVQGPRSPNSPACARLAGHRLFDPAGRSGHLGAPGRCQAVFAIRRVHPHSPNRSPAPLWQIPHQRAGIEKSRLLPHLGDFGFRSLSLTREKPYVHVTRRQRRWWSHARDQVPSL